MRLILALTIALAASAQHPHGDDPHRKGVNQRGDKVMGFSHEKTTHHFSLTTTGGIIQVEANDAKDAASRDQIRMHLNHIATRFAAGDFQAPMLIHAKTPPGVPVLQSRKAALTYRAEQTQSGARVVITTRDPEARKAVHEFLRFQIADHKTGDSTEVR